MQDARRNAASGYALPVDLFGRSETGWAVYAPRVTETIGSAAPADSPAFAAALRAWRRGAGQVGAGAMDAASLLAMKRAWQAARPFVVLRAEGVCPDPPAAAALSALQPSESYGGRPLRLRRGALAAYRRMVRYARRTEPALRSRPGLLQVFSAFRSPERDATRCAAEGNCQGVVRAALRLRELRLRARALGVDRRAALRRGVRPPPQPWAKRISGGAGLRPSTSTPTPSESSSPTLQT